MKKRVSILLSCFDGSTLIEEYIDALLTPSIVDYCQLIAVDFPSSHEAPYHVRSQLHRFPDLIYVEPTANLSLYEAWNLAARRADTEFLSNLNLDDRVDPHYYERGCQILSDENGDVFSADSTRTTMIGTASPDAKPQKMFPNEFVNGRGVFRYGIEQMVYAHRECIRKRNPPHCAPIWRRSLHAELGYFDCGRFDFAADFEFWLRVAAAKKTLLYSTERMVLFYASNKTASGRLLHNASQHIIDEWNPTFPPPDYRESTLGRARDHLHHCMNLHAIFSSRNYFNHIDHLVSVVVVAHQRPDLLKRCLESIRSQQSTLFECIVVLDGDDPHGLVEAAQAVTNDDKRFSFVTLGAKRERNYARNAGIALAAGRWVTIVDGDDELPPASLLLRVRAAQSTPSSIVFGGLNIISEEAPPITTKLQNQYRLADIRLGWPSHCTLLLPAKLAKSVGYPASRSDARSAPSEVAGEDVSFMISLLKAGKISQFVNIGAPVYSYRRYRSSSYLYRDVSIRRVIDVLLKQYGPPKKSDEAYRISLMDRALTAYFWSALRRLEGDARAQVTFPPDDNLHALIQPATGKDLDRTFTEFRRDAETLMSLPPTLLEKVRRAVESAVLGSAMQRPSAAAASRAGPATQRSPNFARLLRWKRKH